MDHQVFVPVSAEAVRQVLREPARVARCLHGFQQDADDAAGPLSGRLKLRVGKHSITYRGALRIAEEPGGFAVEGEGTEARGSGSVLVTLTIRPQETDGGTTLSVTGGTRAVGRLAELPAHAREQAAHRLLDRFGERLAEESARPLTGGPARPGGSEGPGPVSSEDAERLGLVDENGENGEGADESGSGGPAYADGSEGPGPVSSEDAERLGLVDDGPGAETPAAPTPEADRTEDADEGLDADVDLARGAGAGSGPDAGLDAVRPEALGPKDELDELEDLSAIPEEPPAEAAHARRTMIGRSAEEVDHAPPRGRYAPVPAPDETASALPLRWIAPAAALAIASAVVVGRALRRRK